MDEFYASAVTLASVDPVETDASGASAVQPDGAGSPLTGGTTGADDRAPRALRVLPAAAVVCWAFSLTCRWLLAPGLLTDNVGDTLWLTGWLAFPLVAAVLLRRRRGRRLGVLFAVVGLATELAAAFSWVSRILLLEHRVTGAGARLGQWSTWLSNELFALAFALAVGLVLLRFPTGRPPSARWRWVDRAALALVGLILVAEGLRPGAITDDRPAGNPLGVDALRRTIAVAEDVVYVGLALVVLLGLTAVVSRWRRSDGLVRAQLATLALAAVYMASMALVGLLTLAAGLRLPTVLGDVVDTSVTAAVPLATAVALLRHRLFDVELALRRSATYLGVSAIVVAVYSASVVLLGRVFDQRSAFGASLVATGLVAVAFGPIKEGVQGAVERMLYGYRRSPYRALARVGEALEAAADPAAVLTAMVESVADALRLPYVALVVGGDSTSPRVERGIAPARPLELPLVFGGAPVGRLLLAPRGVGERFGDADLRLLTDIGRSVSGAVHALALNDHLQESRERLVLAREEERRRVRRDLHDGLGPSLAAVTLQIDGLRRTLPVEVAAGCDEAFAEVKSEVTSCVAEVRRLVSGLRPPALDELGLAKAVAQQARLLTGSGCLVELDIALPRDLPAALEVAAFRIVSEALHNVARHAAADRVLVRVADETDGLHLEVRDDGRGLGPVPNPRSGTGVGLASMRERAEELGGRLTVEPAEGAGTVVRALLPAHVL